MTLPVVRIVQMTFKPENVLDFLNAFNEVKADIRAAEGCLHLELLRDLEAKNVYYTYSVWATEGHLAAYRNSPLFERTWSTVKKYFGGKPEARTLLQHEVVLKEG